jgi:hypothetical protein
MARRKSKQLESLTRRIVTLDPGSIDQLYGLEPVYEPGAGPRALHFEEFIPIRCPYCAERLETRVDLTAGECRYVEDCQVCCRPMEIGVELEEDGALRAVRVQRLD